MPVELKVPSMGESITEVQIGAWIKNPGEFVQADEPVVELESDKATMEFPAPVSGKITEILKKSGDEAAIGDVIGYMEEVEAPAESAEASPAPTLEAKPADEAESAKSTEKPTATTAKEQPEAAEPEARIEPVGPAAEGEEEPTIMPSARRALAQTGLSSREVQGTGPGGRILKEDVLRTAEAFRKEQETPNEAIRESARTEPIEPSERPAAKTVPVSVPVAPSGTRDEEEIRMSPIRRTIAERLVEAQQSAALLTTFNEIDMSAVIAMRKKFQEDFVERHGLKLGFMSFFVKAAVEALRLVPEVNAEIRGNSIVYKHYCDIGIAVGGGKGLVVPVLRNAETMSFAQIETQIADFAGRAQKNQLSMEELKGGTFTISNGGVYGSMLSTPIVNPPQSGVLGMHNIQDRPVALDGQVVIRPMMYVALTYDHRVVDGKGAVTFLRRIKACIEQPERLFLEI